MSLTVLAQPAAGWYPDPAGAAAYRWWDGAAWTEGTHPGVVEEASILATPEPLPVLEPEPVFTPEPVLAPLPVVAPLPSTPAVRRGASTAKTRWSSLLAAYPVVYPIAVGMVTALAYAGGAASSTPTLVAIAAVAAGLGLIPAWAFAANDRRELTERGYEPVPALAWMLLLPPIAYLIARRRALGTAR